MAACRTSVCAQRETNAFAIHGKCVSLTKCLVTFYYLSTVGHSCLRGILGNVVFSQNTVRTILFTLGEDYRAINVAAALQTR